MGTRGSTHEVGWAITANHGGGYSYRLCPTSTNVTEECFQQHHLRFASGESWIQYVDDKSNRTTIPAIRVSKGTFPKGSMWSRNPIPACAGPYGGVGIGGKAECSAPQFEPPLPGLFGGGASACFCGSGGAGAHCTMDEWMYWLKKFNFTIIDEVVVPKNIPNGDYVLSFRYDSEQTPQVWNSCADLVITSEDPVVHV